MANGRILQLKEQESSSTSAHLFFENGIYRLLTVSDVAGILKCSVGTVRNWVYRGLIPTVRPMPRMVRIDPRELWNWLSERKEFS